MTNTFTYAHLYITKHNDWIQSAILQAKATTEAAIIQTAIIQTAIIQTAIIQTAIIQTASAIAVSICVVIFFFSLLPVSMISL